MPDADLGGPYLVPVRHYNRVHRAERPLPIGMDKGTARADIEHGERPAHLKRPEQISDHFEARALSSVDDSTSRGHVSSSCGWRQPAKRTPSGTGASPQPLGSVLVTGISHTHALSAPHGFSQPRLLDRAMLPKSVSGVHGESLLSKEVATRGDTFVVSRQVIRLVEFSRRAADLFQTGVEAVTEAGKRGAGAQGHAKQKKVYLSRYIESASRRRQP